MNVLFVAALVVSLAVTFAEEKCSFRGKGNTCNAQIRKFGETSPSPYTAPCNTGLVLVEVNGTDDECRHQFTAKVTGSCGLAEVWFKFGKEPGVSESEYPHEIKIKKTATGDFKVTIDGHWIPAVSSVNDVIFEDDVGDLRLRIWLSASPQGHDTVRITNTPAAGNTPKSPCEYTVRYHLQDPTRTEILYENNSPSGGSGACYP